MEPGTKGSKTLPCMGLTYLDVWERWWFDLRGEALDIRAFGELDLALNDSPYCDLR